MKNKSNYIWSIIVLLAIIVGGTMGYTIGELKNYPDAYYNGYNEGYNTAWNEPEFALISAKNAGQYIDNVDNYTCDLYEVMLEDHWGCQFSVTLPLVKLKALGIDTNAVLELSNL